MGGGSGAEQRPPASFAPTGSITGHGGPPAASGRRAAGGARTGTPTAAAGAARAVRKPTGYHRFIDYPRHDKTGFRRWLPSWRLLLGLFLTGVVAVVLVIVIWYNSVPIPNPSDLAGYQTTTVYFSDGTTPMGSFSEQNRVIVGQDQIPQHVRDAVVAAEDRTFYENPGINPTGIARALWQNLRGGHRQGGSSITQQYAERYYSDESITDIRGKIEEAMLAVKLARLEDKDTILANYLNTIYFGRDSYGIETAARAYFQVGVADLDVSQAALLAGVIPSPNNFDPRVSPEQALRRWNYVLDGMVVTGTLTQAERDAQVFPAVVDFAPPQVYAGPNGYLLDMVRREITSQSGITETDLDHGGFSIVTTIDKGLQDMAVAAVQTVPADKPANLQTALVTLERQTGAILALYGGADYITRAQNAVTQDIAQAGSTFKPFTLVAYLEAGGSLKSTYEGRNRMPVEGFPDGVRNYGDSTYGKLGILEATAKSVNAVFAQMNVEVGFDRTLEVAQKAGMCASWARAEEDCALFDNQHYASNVLGTASPHPLDMAQAFNTLAAQGVRTEPFIVRSVTYPDGEVAYENTQTPEQVFDANIMADTTYALRQPIEAAGGTARGARAVGQPVAGKTGSSNDNLSAWFIGYSMYMTTAVAMYQQAPDGNPESITPFGGERAITGGTFPLQVWTSFMTAAHQGREVIDFPPPADVGTPNTPPMVVVPNVLGMTEADAVAALQAVLLVPATSQSSDPTVPVGSVLAQDPAGGEVEQGSTVNLAISTGPGETAVPDVVGQSESSATTQLENAGFTVTVEQAEHLTVPSGDVISQSPAGGSMAPPGSAVTIVVSTGPLVVVDPLPPPPPPAP